MVASRGPSLWSGIGFSSSSSARQWRSPGPVYPADIGFMSSKVTADLRSIPPSCHATKRTGDPVDPGRNGL